MVAFGLSDGTVKLWDPAATSPNLIASYTPSGGDPNDPHPIDAVTFVDRVVGTAGAQDVVAVSSKKDSAQVLRYDGSTALKTQAVGSGGVTTTTRGGIQSWFPGYKAGRIQFANVAYEPLSISFSSRPNEAYGCWFAPAFPASGELPASAAFPSGSEIRLETAQTTGRYTVGGLTAAVSGNCAGDKDDSVAQWAAYLVVTPLRRPADTVTVKLVINRDGTVTPTTVGGGLTVSQDHAGGGWALGNTTLRIRGPQEPRPAAPLTLKGVQLDPVGTERPVYRLDVPASAWNAARTTPPRVSMVVDPITVWGYNGRQFVQLGLLAPQGVPTRSGSSGSVTLAPVSFYWRNPPIGEGDQITSFHLRSGSAETNFVTSNAVQLASLTPTADGAVVDNVSVCPVNASAKCDDGAQPFANGLDQTPLRIQLFDETGTVLPVSDPGYGRVYYTDQDDQLVTGLIPLAPEQTYVRVSPYPGAYANDGVSPTTPRTPPTKVGGRYGYLSTNDPNGQTLTAHVGGVLREGGDIGVDARTFSAPTLQPSGSQLSVSNGFYLTGCSGDDDNRCAIANPKTTATAFQPALYFTTDPDDGKLKIGLQFATVAQTATSSLPLQQVANQDEHLVAAAGLAVNSGEISFSAAASSFQPADNITTWVVTHGQQVQIRSVNVGQSN